MRKILKGVMAAFLLLANVASWGAETKAVTSMPKSEWLEAYNSYWSENVCQQNPDMLQQLQVNQMQCMLIMEEAMAACIKQYETEMPQTIVLETHAKEWGGKLAECAAEKFLASLTKSSDARPDSNPNTNTKIVNPKS